MSPDRPLPRKISTAPRANCCCYCGFSKHSNLDMLRGSVASSKMFLHFSSEVRALLKRFWAQTVVNLVLHFHALVGVSYSQFWVEDFPVGFCVKRRELQSFIQYHRAFTCKSGAKVVELNVRNRATKSCISIYELSLRRYYQRGKCFSLVLALVQFKVVNASFENCKKKSLAGSCPPKSYTKKCKI